ncbi:hypothetical protein [Paenibacillus humicola]|uniref:hypothetical protein n=1 Tax=Paenibacillus humicola TaxID=3110540 RepID=UPI00237C4ADE|nr:hypothetical protein [Paenibacillus humicola]
MKKFSLKGKFNVKRTGYLFGVLTLTVLAASMPTYAAGAEPNIVVGAQKLMQDALKWVLILVPVSATLMIGFHGWMKSMADGDPGAIADRNRKMKNVAVGAAIAECASGLVTVLLTYFPSGS